MPRITNKQAMEAMADAIEKSEMKTHGRDDDLKIVRDYCEQPDEKTPAKKTTPKKKK
ncbi:MAG: hypothetical protein KAS57_03895 [Gammaproteobacteria bacterium]|nr:hypothetical protein [Gammaproteobacteria bacterium]